MITADTITDDQIRTLRNMEPIFSEAWWQASRALSPRVDTYGQTWDRSITRARTRCAEILNARAKEI